MNRSYYSDSITSFLKASPDEILGALASKNEFSLEQTQRKAWQAQIMILKGALASFRGNIYFEYAIPRMGSRIDTVLLIGPAIFVLEFKVGEQEFKGHAVDQVWDYALDLKNFHESSHALYIAPILIATEAPDCIPNICFTHQNDHLMIPIKTNASLLKEVFENVLNFVEGDEIERAAWERGRYHPTPTIIEAAKALYNDHTVAEISRNDASAINLSKTTKAIDEIIKQSKALRRKSLCFVTGVPGAGKTLVGLNVATKHTEEKDELFSVFLSGNGPLVSILREALARDQVMRAKQRGEGIKKTSALSEVKAFVQNIHHFRDECLKDLSPPVEHVALFDEAQRAWNLEQTAAFMRRKKGIPNFEQSEPEFLISCLNRHSDWAVIVCLVGGGQEINTGEAGISEWVESLNRKYLNWHVYISPRLQDTEYSTEKTLKALSGRDKVEFKEDLHLAVSMRSFRAENVSLLVKQVLDIDIEGAHRTLKTVIDKYPIIITRDIKKAKNWLKKQARGSERYGIVVSSQAERLKPHAIDVKSPINPINWFLDGKEDVRSSYYLEAVATEFHIQGLELDWACVAWDADFRYTSSGWEHKSFRGSKWQNINKEERKTYLKNAYRVLLTRARQGMVIVVPQGDLEDATRNPAFYDSTFDYLCQIGFSVLD